VSRETRRVDRVALAWISRQPAPTNLLKAVTDHFRRSGGRLGYILTSEAAARMGGGRADDDVQILRLNGGGTLTCHMTDVSNPTRVIWSHGELTLFGPGFAPPATILAAISGRLGDIVTHPLLPADAVVVSCMETKAGLAMECQEFSVLVAEAFEHLAQLERKAA
jgi:hypothetical protein